MHSYETRKNTGFSLKDIIRVKNKFAVVKLETRLKLSLINHGLAIEVFDLSNNLINKSPTITITEKYFGLSGMTTSRYLYKNKPYEDYFFKSSIKDN
jgi:hypothetical protein